MTTESFVIVSSVFVSNAHSHLPARKREGKYSFRKRRFVCVENATANVIARVNAAFANVNFIGNLRKARVLLEK
jgi:hypothetical protein